MAEIMGIEYTRWVDTITETELPVCCLTLFCLGWPEGDQWDAVYD